MRSRDLERLLIEWQAALSLLDWEVEVELVNDNSLGNKLGEVEYSTEERTASIRIAGRKPKQELTLVHELCHLWTRQVRETRDDISVLMEEQAVEAISKCLVALKEQGG